MRHFNTQAAASHLPNFVRADLNTEVAALVQKPTSPKINLYSQHICHYVPHRLEFLVWAEVQGSVSVVTTLLLRQLIEKVVMHFRVPKRTAGR